MPQNLDKDGLKSLINSYELFFIDIWGVIHNGLQIFEDSIEVLENLKKNNKEFVLLTNAPRPNSTVIDFLKKMGLKKFYEEVYTSGEASLKYLMENFLNSKFYHIGPSRDFDLFKRFEQNKVSNINQADYFICTGLFEDHEVKLDYYKDLLEKFSEEFEQAKEEAEDLMERNKPIDTQIVCDCGNNKKMQLRTNQSGQFLGCEAFILEGEQQCKKTLSLLDEDLFSDSDDKEAESIFNKTKCDVCNSAMDGYIIDNNRKLEICSNSPICSGTKLVEGEFIKPKNEDEEFIDCHKCDNKMELKLGRFFANFLFHHHHHLCKDKLFLHKL